MTATQLNPKLFGLIAAIVLVAAALLVLRSGVVGSSGSESSTAPAVKSPTHAATGANPTKPTKPTVVLLPGLPGPIANALRKKPVVVTSLFVSTAPLTRSAVGEARTGAKTVGAGFVSVNLLNEKLARQMQSMVGPTSVPVTLIVRRPGKVVSRLDGYADSELVAQAAQNAGASR